MNVETSYEGIEQITFKEPREDLPFLELGEYPKFEVTRVSDGFSKKDDRQFFAVEGIVHESSGPNANPAGTKAVVIIKKGAKDAKFNYFLKDVKKITAAILGEHWKNITSPTIKTLLNLSREGKMPSSIVSVSVFCKEGKTFKNVEFKAIEEVSGKVTSNNKSKKN